MGILDDNSRWHPQQPSPAASGQARGMGMAPKPKPAASGLWQNAKDTVADVAAGGLDLAEMAVRALPGDSSKPGLAHSAVTAIESAQQSDWLSGANQERDSIAGRAWHEGVRSLVPSMAPVAAGAASGAATGAAIGSVVPGAGTVAGGVVGAGVGLLTSVGLFGSAAYDEFYEECKKNGVPDDVAKSAAMRQAWLQGGLEGVSTVVDLATAKLGSAALAPLKQAVKGSAEKALARETARSMLEKGLAGNLKDAALITVKSAPMEIGTEMYQNYGEAKLRQKTGLETVDPITAAKAAIGPAAVMQMLFGVGATGINAHKRGQIAKSLSDPAIDAQQRRNAASFIAGELAKVDKQNGDTHFSEAWQFYAGNRIEDAQPIDLDANLFKLSSKPKPAASGLWKNDKATTASHSEATTAPLDDVPMFDQGGAVHPERVETRGMGLNQPFDAQPAKAPNITPAAPNIANESPILPGENAEDLAMAYSDEDLDRHLKNLDIETAANDANVEPSAAQKEAGNYQKGHIKLHGLDISIENPAGSDRTGTDADGNEWRTRMNHHYGYIRGTIGKDKDHLDIFMGDNPASERVFVVNQVDPKTGKFDEHKVMLGFDDAQQAKDAYESNYEQGWQGFGSMSEMSIDDFKVWSKDSNLTRKPLGKLPKRETAGNMVSAKIEEPASNDQQMSAAAPAAELNATGQGLASEQSNKADLPGVDAVTASPEKAAPAITPQIETGTNANGQFWSKITEGVGTSTYSHSSSGTYRRMDSEGGSRSDSIMGQDGEWYDTKYANRVSGAIEEGDTGEKIPIWLGREDERSFVSETSAMSDDINIPDQISMSLYKLVGRLVRGEITLEQARAERDALLKVEQDQPIEQSNKADLADAEAGAAPSVQNDPWQMTRDEWVDGHIRSPAMHREHIAQALSSGKPVPAHVLKDYPDIQKAYDDKVAAWKMIRHQNQDGIRYEAVPDAQTSPADPADEKKPEPSSRRRENGQTAATGKPDLQVAAHAATQQPSNASSHGEDNPSLTIEDYSEKSIVVRGDTKPYKAELVKLKGLWSVRLKGGPGWIFSKKKEAEVRALVDRLNAAATDDNAGEPGKKTDKPAPAISAIPAKNDVRELWQMTHHEAKLHLAKARFEAITQALDSGKSLSVRTSYRIIPLASREDIFMKTKGSLVGECKVKSAGAWLTLTDRQFMALAHEAGFVESEDHVGAVNEAFEAGKPVSKENLEEYGLGGHEKAVPRTEADDRGDKLDKHQQDLEKKGATRVGAVDYSIQALPKNTGFYYTRTEKGIRVEKGGGYPALWSRDKAIEEAMTEIGRDLMKETGNQKAEKQPVKTESDNQSVGKHGTAATEAGTRIDFHYAVIEAADLVTSHDDGLNVNPDYPQALQPRDRSRIASKLQIEKIINDLNPERLGANPMVTDGAPVVGGDLVVESGNGRTIALRKGYARQDKSLDKYRQWLLDNAAGFGLNHPALEVMQNPILVRVRETEVDRAQFAREANQASVAAMSANEQAKQDAKLLMDGTLLGRLQVASDGEILTAQNYPVIRDFLGRVVGSDLGAYVDKDGRLSKAALTRFQNALFAAAYGETSALETLTESLDDAARNVTIGLLMAAPKLAVCKLRHQHGALVDADITPHAAKAAAIYRDLKARGESLEGFLNQLTMFGEVDEITANVLNLFKRYNRSGIKIGTVLNLYAEHWTNCGDPRQESLFGKKRDVEIQSLLARAISEVDGGKVDQESLFAIREDRPGAEADAGQELGNSAPEGHPEAKGETGEVGYLSKLKALDGEAAKILKAVVADLDGEGSRKIENAKGFMAVHVEKIGRNRYSIAHYYEQNGDLMSDPRMEFVVDGAKIYPVYFRQDGSIPMETEVLDYHDNGAPYVADEKGARQLAKFANQWMRNIQMQQDVLGVELAKTSENDDNTRAGKSRSDEVEGVDNGEDSESRTVRADEADVHEAEPASDAQGVEAERGSGELSAQAGSPGERSDRNDDQSGSSTGRSSRDSDLGEHHDHGRANAGRGARPDSPGHGSELQVLHGGSQGDAGSLRHVLLVDYRITARDELGKGGAKQKYRDNLAAIRILKACQAEGRPATPEEQSKLVKYVGWGGLPQAFTRPDGSSAKGWESETRELQEVLTPHEHAEAAKSTRNAHYTSSTVIDGVYKALQHMGFQGGRVLEPSVGSGNFIGLMPEAMKGLSRFSAVELDPITGGIAQLLYPNQNIKVGGFEDFDLAENSMDAAIGNPPFGSITLVDRKNPDLKKFSIHNFFFAKSLKGVRENGLLAMVVSNSLLDKQGGAQRKYLAQRAEFLGAIRLPNTAFAENANTEVTTDIIFLRKLAAGESPKGESWTGLEQVPDPDGKEPIPINEYFARHPEMMLGTMARRGSMYREDMPALVPHEGKDLAALLDEAVARLPQNIYTAAGRDAKQLEQAGQAIKDIAAGWTKPNGFIFSQDGHLLVRRSDLNGEPVFEPAQKFVKSSETFRDFTKSESERIRGMLKIRDALRDLMAAEQKSDTNLTHLDLLRDKLNNVYDAYVKKHGYLNEESNQRAFSTDPDAPLLLSLERRFQRKVTKEMAAREGIEPKPAVCQKADIFSRRIQSPYAPARKASSTQDALSISLAESGRIDLDRIHELTGESREDILKNLEGVIFDEPGRGLVPADEYLSGNVKKKLAAAQTAAKDDQRYLKNVKALMDVQPKDVAAHDIRVKLGAPWVPAAIYEEFARVITGSRNASVVYYPSVGRWEVKIIGGDLNLLNNRWGIPLCDAGDILGSLISGHSIAVYDEDANGQRVMLIDKTAEANAKAAEIKAEFERWLWDDPGRRQQLAQTFNDKFNSYVERVYDGSHMVFPGKVSDAVIELRPHQKNAIWRMVQKGVALLDHQVGAGKTYTMIGAAMEMRRMGLARKPLFVVPNHLVAQWASSFYELYPGANVLMISSDDFSAKNRKVFFGRIATGDYDAVVMAHSSFGFIKPPASYEETFLLRQVADYEQAITQAAEEEKRQGKRKRGMTRKVMEDRKARLENQLKMLRERPKDDIVDFGDLGIDALFVDEAHEFKNLFFHTTKDRVAGLGSPEGSQKAYDMYAKTSYISDTFGRGVFFATGTPVSNTMGEMFTMQRYLQGQALRENGLHVFDAWADTFADPVSDYALDPSGIKYRMETRLKKFVNLPELMALYRDFADIITQADLEAQAAKIGQRWPIPRVKGGKPSNIVVPRSRDQQKFMDFIIHRMEHMPKDASADNTLKAMSDARKGALDIRLIDPNAKDDPNSKVNQCVKETLRIYHKWSARKGTQLIFCDLSIPKSAQKEALAELEKYNDLKEKEAAGADVADELDKIDIALVQAGRSSFSVYDDIKRKLVSAGVPISQVAFIHDANTNARKEALFEKMRSGDVRVLIGSTFKMGAGMNVQDQLVALHDLDCPWRPSDLEQREGRILRQGNQFYKEDPDSFEIEILRYATDQTLDSRMWQTIEDKAGFIQQLKQPLNGQREIEDIQGEAANAAEMKAAASGNPLILEEVKLRDAIKRLESSERLHDRARHVAQDAIKVGEGAEDRYKRDLAEIEDDHKRACADDNPSGSNEWSIEIGGKTFSVAGKDKEAAKAEVQKALSAIKAAINTMALGNHRELPLGSYRGFDLTMYSDVFRNLDITVDSRFHDSTIQYPAADVANLSPSGLITRLDNQIKRMASKKGHAEALEGLKEARDKALARAAEARETIEKPFAQADELTAMRRRHSELVVALQNQKSEKNENAKTVPAADHFFRWAQLTGVKPEGVVSLDEANATDEQDEAARFRVSHQTDGMSAEDVADAIWPIYDGWRSRPGFRIVQSIEELPDGLRRQLDDAQGSVTGAYYKGEIFLVADNLTGAEEAQKTLLHEGLGHWGLRQIFGQDYERFLKRASLSVGKSKLQGIANLYELDLNNPEDHLVAVEEYIAHIAETGENPSLWRQFVTWFKEQVAKLGFNVDLTDDDIRTILNRAVSRPQNSGKGSTFTDDSARARRSQPAADLDYHSQYEDVDERMLEAEKPIAGKSLQDRLLEKVERLYNSWTRHFEDLDPKLYGNLSNKLRLFEETPKYAKHRAMDSVSQIVAGMDENEMRLFTRLVALPDIIEDIKSGLIEPSPDNPISFGYDEVYKIKQDLAKWEAEAKKSPRVQKALALRKRIMEEHQVEMVNHGLLPRSILSKEGYFHHRVIEKLEERESKGTGTSTGDVRNHRKGFQKARVGSVKDYSLNYLEAEFEVLAQGIAQIETKKTLDIINRECNVMGECKRKAKRANEQAVIKMMLDDGSLGHDAFGQPEDPFKDHHKKMAMGFSRLAKMAYDGLLEIDPDRPDLDLAADQLAAEWQLKGNRMDAEDSLNTRPKVFALMSYLLENDLPGADAAALIFKGIREKEAFISEMLGSRKLTWRSKGIMPQGYTIWRPKENTGWSGGITHVERLIEQLASGEKTVDEIEPELKRIAAMGAATQWVIPTEVAHTLDNFRDFHNEGFMSELSDAFMNGWKQWMLFNPQHAFKYNWNNATGDFDICFAYEPKIVTRYARQAAKDMLAFHYNRGMGQDLRTELNEAVRQGVIGSGMTVQDIPDITENLKEGEFLALMGARKTNGFEKYWGAVKTASTYRENVLRLAAWRYFKDELTAGRQHYGVSKRHELDQISNQGDQAAKLARDLLGDYGNISVAAQWVRRRLIPFFSWMAINAPRYVRLFKNMPAEHGVKLMTLKGAKTTAKLSGQALFLYLFVNMFNHLVWPDEEDELSATDRGQLHLILGRREDGSIITLRMQGALSDALGWFGAENFPNDLAELINGEASVGDKLVEAGKAPVNRLVNSALPIAKGIGESVLGSTYYPDLWNPRPVRDKVEHIARTFAIDPLYRRAVGRPSRGVMYDVINLIGYSADGGECAYYDIRNEVIKYKEAHGGSGGTFIPDSKNKNNALYYYKQALKFGDLKAADKYLKQYSEMGGTWEGLDRSIQAAAPLAGLKQADQNAFYQGLSPAKRETLKRAQQWYDQTYLARGFNGIATD